MKVTEVFKSKLVFISLLNNECILYANDVCSKDLRMYILYAKFSNLSHSIIYKR